MPRTDPSPFFERTKLKLEVRYWMGSHSILVFHGSSRKQANEKVVELVRKLDLSDDQAISVAFLEFATPHLSTVLRSLSQTKNTSVTIFPVFLSEGNHVRRDIPNIVENACSNGSRMKIKVVPAFGASESFEQALSHFIFGAATQSNEVNSE